MKNPRHLRTLCAYTSLLRRHRELQRAERLITDALSVDSCYVPAVVEAAHVKLALKVCADLCCNCLGVPFVAVRLFHHQ